MKDISLVASHRQLNPSEPITLLPIFKERVWGRTDLSPFYPDFKPSSPVGEVWFTYQDNRTSRGVTLRELLRENPEILGQAADPNFPEVCPLLVKLLFTNERLSVQVHPDDEYAGRHHQSLGKTEAWYVMDSRAPGEVAVGFLEELEAERLKESAISGEIENLLHWRCVDKGDVIFTPAGTVHAIGAGLTICEIQQNSDITYRLYDYGRPRELHLDHGARVSDLGPHTHAPEFKTLREGRTELLACDYFRIEKLTPARELRFQPAPFYMLLICLAGQGTLGAQFCKAGDAYLLPAHGNETALNALGSEWIVTYTAPEAFEGIF